MLLEFVGSTATAAMRPLALAPPPAAPPAASFRGPGPRAVQVVLLGGVKGGTIPGGVNVGPKCAMGAFNGSVGGFNRRGAGGGVVCPKAAPAKARTINLRLIVKNGRPNRISPRSCQAFLVISVHP